MTKKFRKKSARILLAAELIFALAVVIAAVRWRQEGDSVVYSLDYSSLDAGKGVSMETFPYSEFSGIYLDNSLMDDGEKVYRVDVVYSTGNSRNFLSVQSGKRWLSTADKAYIALPEGEDRTESVILRTFFSMDDLSISVHYPGDGYIYVTGVTVTRIPGFPWPFLILGIELFAVLHILSFLWRRYGECGGRRKILVFLLGLSVTVSLPIFSVYLGTGDDLEYHLLRIDALAAGLRSGQFPVRVSSYWNNGYGYGSSLYYCDFFLLFPALLRIGGLSVQSAYKQYLFAVNCLTAALCWYSFRKIGGRKSAALGTILYMFLPYRILCLYRRAAVGEYTAMAFLPLAAAGMYQIYTSRTLQQRSKLQMRGNDTAADRSAILPAVLGFSGLILSHIITTFIAVIAAIIVLLILIRKTCGMISGHFMRRRKQQQSKNTAPTSLSLRTFFRPLPGAIFRRRMSLHRVRAVHRILYILPELLCMEQCCGLHFGGSGGRMRPGEKQEKKTDWKPFAEMGKQQGSKSVKKMNRRAICLVQHRKLWAISPPGRG